VLDTFYRSLLLRANIGPLGTARRGLGASGSPSSPVISNSEVDRLGDRLRSVGATAGDLLQLDLFRETFLPAYQSVYEQLRITGELFSGSTVIPGQALSGRPRKSALSIIGKLQRQPHTRLSQMQDIAGCRLIVPTALAQEISTAILDLDFEPVATDDRRTNPSHGYRAVHLVVNRDGKMIEVQIRTVAQDTWAQISEKLADKFGQPIKYGAEVPSRPAVRRTLDALSAVIQASEENFAKVSAVESWFDDMDSDGDAGVVPEEVRILKNALIGTERSIRLLSGSLVALLDEVALP
jgi:ppGpp synthetase/RelA/SpoT-type nucleotidyltranferase